MLCSQKSNLQFTRMQLILQVGLLLGLSGGTEDLQGDLADSLSAALVPIADLVGTLQAEMMLMKNTQIMQQREFADLMADLQHIKKEKTDPKSEVIELKKVVSNNMDPQLKEQVMNTFKLDSIEEDVQQNQEDIIDLR